MATMGISKQERKVLKEALHTQLTDWDDADASTTSKSDRRRDSPEYAVAATLLIKLEALD